MTNIYFSQIWRSEYQHGQFLVKTLFQAANHQLLIVPSHVRKTWDRSLGSLLYGHQSHSPGLQPHELITSQRPPPNTIMLRVRILTYEFWGSQTSILLQTMLGSDVAFLFIAFVELPVGEDIWAWCQPCLGACCKTICGRMQRPKSFLFNRCCWISIPFRSCNM